MHISKFLLSNLLFFFWLSGCSNPQSGPDKTASGAMLGSAWGAGAGAVVGHQLSYAGEGTAVGAGFGLVSGALSGLAYDLSEGAQLEQDRQLAALKVQNETNAKALDELQSRLDQTIASDLAGGIYQVFFDADSTSMRAGAVANLEVIAEQIKSSPHASVINVVGHADDSGSPDYNQRVAEARARNVAGYLAARGISFGQIVIKHFGSQRPIASNGSVVGRQLNRRVDVFIGTRG